MVVDTAWDDATEGEAFRAGADAVAAALDGEGSVARVLGRDDENVVILIASDADTLGRTANVLGLAG